MAQKKKALILTVSLLHNAPRVIREIDALIDEFDITVTGTSEPHRKDVSYVHSSLMGKTFLEKIIYKVPYYLSNFIPFKTPATTKKVAQLINKINPDLVIVHKPVFFPYLFDAERSYKVVYNAHEYHPLEFEDDKAWMKVYGKYYYKLYQAYLKKCDLVVNVSNGIIQKCESEFGVPSLLVPNASGYYEIDAQPKAYQFPIRFIHHGGPNPDRKIEEMISAFKILGKNYTLDLMLVKNDSAYFKMLEKLVVNVPNVNLIPPVSFNSIVPFISQYDAAVYVIPPVSFNNTYALPNKFFEFIQARLPIVTGPSPEMKAIIEKYQIGDTASDFSAQSLAEKIRSITSDKYNTYRQNTVMASKELSAEKYMHRFVNEIKRILAN